MPNNFRMFVDYDEDERERLLDERIKRIELDNRVREQEYNEVLKDIKMAEECGQSFQSTVTIRAPKTKPINWGPTQKNSSRNGRFNNLSFSSSISSIRQQIEPNSSQFPPKQEISKIIEPTTKNTKSPPRVKEFTNKTSKSSPRANNSTNKTADPHKITDRTGFQVFQPASGPPVYLYYTKRPGANKPKNYIDLPYTKREDCSNKNDMETKLAEPPTKPELFNPSYSWGRDEPEEKVEEPPNKEELIDYTYEDLKNFCLRNSAEAKTETIISKVDKSNLEGGFEFVNDDDFNIDDLVNMTWTRNEDGEIFTEYKATETKEKEKKKKPVVDCGFDDLSDFKFSDDDFNLEDLVFETSC